MAFMMEKILSDAQKLASRLKEHDGSTDNLVEEMTTLNKKIDSMKTFQENLPDLSEMALRKPRCAIKLGLSQENSQIRELEQENKDLKQSLEEHELALELIMSKYRQQVSKLLRSNQVDKSMLDKETVQAKEVQEKAEKIHEMGSVMWKAIGEDDHDIYDTQQVLSQLTVENRGMMELVSICCNSGNPLRIVNRQTQTDSQLSAECSDLCTGMAASGELPSAFGDRRAKTEAPHTPLNSRRSDAFHDDRAEDLKSQTSQGSIFLPPKDSKGSGTAGAILQRSTFVSPPMPDLQPANGARNLSSSESQSQQTSPSMTTLVPSALPDLINIKSSSGDISLEERSNAETSSSAAAISSLEADARGVQGMSSTPELLLDNVGHTTSNCADENQILNHVEDHDDRNDPLNAVQIDAVSQTLSAPTATIEGPCGNSEANALKTVSSPPSSSTATVAMTTEPSSTPVRITTGHFQKSKSPVPKKSPAGSRNVSVTSGTPKNPSSSGYGAAPKQGAAASSVLHSKTPPGKSVTTHIGASSSPSNATVKPLSSGSPSLQSGKTPTTGLATRATPVRIKTTAKHPSLSTVFGPASAAPSATVPSSGASNTSSAVLDNNGNSSRNSGVLNEISNMNNAPTDKTIEDK